MFFNVLMSTKRVKQVLFLQQDWAYTIKNRDWIIWAVEHFNPLEPVVCVCVCHPFATIAFVEMTLKYVKSQRKYHEIDLPEIQHTYL